MSIEITPQQREEIMHSLKKYFATELEEDLGDLRARLLLDYILKEIAPLAYNAGVKEAERFLQARLEDMTATVFEPAFTYWKAKRK